MADRVEHLCVATLPDQREFRFGTYDFNHGLTSMLERIVRESGVKTSRKDPQKINISVARLQPPKTPHADWLLVPLGLYPVMPPLTRMTKNELDDESNQLLLRIPPPLHAALRQLAWEYGHSSGMEEVFNYLQELVGALEQPLAAYRQQLLDRDSPGA